MTAPQRGETPASYRLSQTRSFSSQVSLITRLLRKRFDERARNMALPTGETLTRAQWRVLAAVHVNPGSTQRDIAERLEIGPAGQTIDGLEKLSWIERRSDATDRRIWRLYVTDAALPLLSRLSLVGHSEYECATIGISDEDMAKLTGLLDKVIANLMSTNADVRS